MRKRKIFFFVFAVCTIILLIKTIPLLINNFNYRSDCLGCKVTLHDESYYSNALVSPDNTKVVYFKTDASYINVSPIFSLFVGEGTNAKQYYKSEKISLCINNLEASNERCIKEIKNKIWPTPEQRDYSKETTSLKLYWDNDGNIIYGLMLVDSVFSPELYIATGQINPQTLKENLLTSRDSDSFQKLWSLYGQYINSNKILVSGRQYGNKGVLYLINTSEKNVTIYIVDPKIKSNFRVPAFINYEFFKKNLNNSLIN
jgi:hypothetical protein